MKAHLAQPVYNHTTFDKTSAANSRSGNFSSSYRTSLRLSAWYKADHEGYIVGRPSAISIPNSSTSSSSLTRAWACSSGSGSSRRQRYAAEETMGTIAVGRTGDGTRNWSRYTTLMMM